MSGGTLDADKNLTVSGALTHTTDITIDVATNKTLTYSGATISVGANTITLTGGGSLVSGGMTLNNANSKLLLNSITLDSASEVNPVEITVQTAGNRSMLGNDFTQVNDLGYGLVVTNGALSEMVSQFTYYC